MDLRKWSESEVEYGREVLDSAMEGARSGREAFLSGRPLIPFLNESARKALVPAAVGACIGVMGSYARNNRQTSLGKTLVFGLLGAVIGFGTGVAWESRRLTASAADGALRNIHKVRDEHWLEKHPVAYD